MKIAGIISNFISLIIDIFGIYTDTSLYHDTDMRG